MASPASVDAFRTLTPDKQKEALGRMSPEAKQALLAGIKGASTETTSTGIVVPRGMIGSDEGSVLGGAARRLGETISGLYHTVADAPRNPEEEKVSQGLLGQVDVITQRISKGVVAGEKEAGRQTAEQLRAASETKGDPLAKGLRYAQAGVTAASMADPFATGSVTNINKLADEGRYKESIGAGAFDALALLAGRAQPFGKSLDVAPSTETSINKLAYATDAKSLRPLEHVLPDIKETIAKVGRPQTVGELQTVIQDTMSRFEQKFNTALAGAKGQVDTTPIANALEVKARSMPPSTDGQNIAAELRSAAAKDYGHPWTVQELNSERMLRNGLARPFYASSDVKQMAAMRTNAETMIDKIVADESRDLLYDELERQFPGQGFRELKAKESSILKMSDNFKDHIDDLEVAQAKSKGAPFLEKWRVSAVATPGSGVHPFVHQPLGRGKVLTKANTAVQRAFGPSKSAATRTAILALPVSSIMQNDTMNELLGKLERGEQLPPLQNYKDVLTKDQMGQLMRMAMEKKNKGSGSGSVQ